MESKSFSSSRKKALSSFLRLAGTILSTVLFFALISRQNWGVVYEKTSSISLLVVFFVFAIYGLGQILNAFRWFILLYAQQVDISFVESLKIVFAGIFASNFLPSTIGGDTVRAVAIMRFADKKIIAIGSIILDRIINMAAMISLLPLPIHVFGLSALSKGLSFQMSMTSWLLLEKLKGFFRHLFPRVVAALNAWRAKPWALVHAYVVGFVSNLLPMLGTFLLARSVGIGVSYYQVVAVQTITYFFSFLPISINGYGVREVLYTTLYTQLGATLEQASILALLSRLLTMLATTPGAFWLSRSVLRASSRKIEL